MANRTDQTTPKQLFVYQRNEITGHRIYQSLAKMVEFPQNSKILEEMADDKHRHYIAWQKYTGQELKPYRWMAWKYIVLSRLLGAIFGLRLMKLRELYHRLKEQIPELRSSLESFIEDKIEHERKVENLKEEKIHYASSMVLGLNDALIAGPLFFKLDHLAEAEG